MKSWLDFCNAPSAIYTSSRHQRVHAAKVLAGVSRFVPAGGGAVVLVGGAATPLPRANSRNCAGRSCCLSPVNSVVQYLSRRQFVDALQLFRRLLKSDGKLLLGDVIEPDTPMLRHGMTFLGFAWQNGFFLAGLLSLARNVASPYCPLRRPCLLPVGRDAGAAGRQRLPRRTIAVQYRRQPVALLLSCPYSQSNG